MAKNLNPFLFCITFFLLRDVLRGVPVERLKKYIESKLQDPSQRDLPTLLQEDPDSYLKSCKTMKLCPETVVFNEEVVCFTNTLSI